MNSTFKLKESFRPDIGWLCLLNSLFWSANILLVLRRESVVLPYWAPYGWNIQKEKRDKHNVKLKPEDMSESDEADEPGLVSNVSFNVVDDFFFGEDTMGIIYGACVCVIAKSRDGIRNKHSTFEIGRQLNLISEGSMRIKTETLTGNE